MRAAMWLMLVGCGRVAFDPVATGNGVADATAPATIAVSAGGFNTCARLPSGEVWCWGVGTSGNLGIGPGAPATTQTPTRVATVTPLVSITTGDAGSCGRTETNGALCWGYNVEGELGVGTMGPVLSPTPVVNETTIAEIALGLSLGCIRRIDGSVACAGSAGVLGDGSNAARSVFGTIPGITTATALALGDSHGCALLADGSTRCWGANDQGQLGDNSMTSRPTAVAGPPGPYTALAAGDQHTCGLRGGNVDCWGAGDLGQLGDGQLGDSPSPLQVADLDDAISIGGAAIATCALRANGTVVCWGGNTHSEVGDGSQTLQPTPVPVVALDNVIALSTHTGFHVCAVRGDRSVWCWGDNTYGQLGRVTSTATSGVPAAVMGI